MHREPHFHGRLVCIYDLSLISATQCHQTQVAVLSSTDHVSVLREALEKQVQKQLEVSTNTRFFHQQLAKQQDPGEESIRCLGPVNGKLLYPTSLELWSAPRPPTEPPDDSQTSRKNSLVSEASGSGSGTSGSDNDDEDKED